MSAAIVTTLGLALMSVVGAKPLAPWMMDAIQRGAEAAGAQFLTDSSKEGRSLQNAFCPRPLFDNFDPTINNAIPGTPCAFACHGTMFDEAELERYDLLEMVTSGIGMVCAVFLVSTYGLFPEKAKQKMTFWMSFCGLIITGSIFIAGLAEGSPNNVWCKSNVEGVKQEDGISWCVVQGISLIYFGLALCIWWWCSCFDIFSKLYLKKKHIEGYLKYYHILAWGIAGVSAAILLGGQHFGFEQPRLWCFLDADSPSAFEFVFFYGIIGILWFTGTIMMLFVVWTIISQRVYGNRGGNAWRKLKLYKTPLIFVTLFSVFWGIFFTFRFITVLDEPQLEDSAASWFGCLLGARFNASIADPAVSAPAGFVALLDPPAPAGQQGCGFVQPGPISPGLLGLATFTISANSIFLFLCFGLAKDNYVLWYRYLSSFGKSEPAQSLSQSGVSTKKPKSQVQLSTFQEIRVAFGSFLVNMFYLISCQQKNMTWGRTAAPQVQRSYDPQAKRNPKFANERYPVSMAMSVAPPGMPGYRPHPSMARQNPAEPFPDSRDYGGRYGNQGSDFSSEFEADPLWGINLEF